MHPASAGTISFQSDATSLSQAMSATNTAPPQQDWELSKENFQPLKAGRKASGLRDNTAELRKQLVEEHKRCATNPWQHFGSCWATLHYLPTLCFGAGRSAKRSQRIAAKTRWRFGSSELEGFDGSSRMAAARAANPKAGRAEHVYSSNSKCRNPFVAACRFIKWTQETFQAGGHKAELLPLLERCTRELQTVPRYKGDIRYLRVWVQYVRDTCIHSLRWLQPHTCKTWYHAYLSHN